MLLLPPVVGYARHVLLPPIVGYARHALLPPIVGYVSVCRPYEASVFETTIRVVGGMLAAFDLSNDRMFIVRSDPGIPTFCDCCAQFIWLLAVLFQAEIRADPL